MINLKKTFKGIVIAAIVAGGAYFGYTTWKTTRSGTPLSMQAPTVSVFKVERHAIYPEASFVAKIESQDTVGLRARVTGFLQEQRFKEGDMVEEGQVLFVIEPVNFEAKVREAEANLASAEAQVVNAKSQYERTKTLYKTKDVSAAKLDETRAAYDMAVATVAQMKANVDLAKKDLEYTSIKAPMSGKLGETRFSVGELVGPDSGTLADIVKINPINAVFSVSENQLLALRQQVRKANPQDVKVRFFMSDGHEYNQAGRLNFIDNALDEAMNTLKIKASFPNPDGDLISGQYGRVVLTGTEQVSEIVIPLRAVQRDMLGAFVYVIGSDNVIEKRAVKTGMELPNFDVVILEGLKQGEQVVIEGFQKIAPNITVTPVTVSVNAVAPETNETAQSK
ncbi:MAG: efflux RND transporter periplasmic adaptor subunit [Alphaproteobacteria bacterium]